jgi:hypothetical protein
VAEIRRGYIKRGTFGKWFEPRFETRFETRPEAGLEVAPNRARAFPFGRHNGSAKPRPQVAITSIFLVESNAYPTDANPVALFFETD